MAGVDGKGREDAPEKPAEKKLDRRDVLRGLSTVPALGLFGYAWKKQHEYEQKPREAGERAGGRGREGRLRGQQDTASMNRELERWVLRMPAQYFWTHKRFKTRPEGEATIY